VFYDFAVDISAQLCYTVAGQRSQTGTPLASPFLFYGGPDWQLSRQETTEIG